MWDNCVLKYRFFALKSLTHKNYRRKPSNRPTTTLIVYRSDFYIRYYCGLIVFCIWYSRGLLDVSNKNARCFLPFGRHEGYKKHSKNKYVKSSSNKTGNAIFTPKHMQNLFFSKSSCFIDQSWLWTPSSRLKYKSFSFTWVKTSQPWWVIFNLC